MGMPCAELLLTLHLFSVHGQAGYENFNPGAGVECRAEQASAAIGAYRNSFDRTSIYAVIGYDFLEVGNQISIGAVGGVASGYEQEWKTPIVAGLRGHVRHGDLELGVLAVPPIGEHVGVVHFTIGFVVDLP